MTEDLKGLREKTVTGLLEEDARVLKKLGTELRGLLEEGDALLSKVVEPTATSSLPDDPLSWWAKNHGGLPESLSFLEKNISEGLQPVFYSLSYYSMTSSQTLYVPVPYQECRRRGYEGFRDTVWLNAPDESEIEENDWMYTARKFSHACSNIPYSVRIGDEPTIGWLSKSHKVKETHYLPDLSEIYQGGSTPTETFSAAKKDEPYLGMASVLYIPLIGVDYMDMVQPELSSEGERHSKSVLIFWSPIPNRWGHLVDGTGLLYDNAYVYCPPSLDFKVGPIYSGTSIRDNSINTQSTISETLLPSVGGGKTIYTKVNHLSDYLSWIEDIIERDNSNQVWRETDYVELVQKVSELGKDTDSSTEEQIRSITHGLEYLLDVMSTQHDKKRWAIPNFIDYTLSDEGLMGDFRKENLVGDYTKVVLTEYGHVKAQSKGSPHTQILKSSKDIERELSIDKDTAIKVFEEPVRNICKNSSGVGRIEFHISKLSVTVRVFETLLWEVSNNLINKKSSFDTYYSIRRGIPISTTFGSQASRGLGLGMAMYSAIAEREGIFNKLYVSPNCEKCYSLTSFPTKSQ
jgi:hypothetical protein